MKYNDNDMHEFYNDMRNYINSYVSGVIKQ